jgi:SAM-dependent methyltransferase
MGIAAASLERDILVGALVNRRLGLYYPIVNGVPRMLVFRTSVHREFERRYADFIARDLLGLPLPDQACTIGERDVLKSFSAEWLNYEWTDAAYWSLRSDVMIRAMRFLLDVDRRPLAGKLVLEFGIGIGGTADHLARHDDCELIGVDLGYAVDAARRHFASNPFLHIAQCSVFAPPFREASFDFVYSHGVIHHTYSTRAAFDQIARLPRHGGRLYVWVYSHFDERRTPVRRLLMAVENVTRPWIARLPAPLQTAALAPFVPFYMAYQAARRWRRGPDQALYGPREAMHAARDRFAPRFIFRHDEAELVDWLRAAGYDAIEPGSSRTPPDFVPESLSAATYASAVRK